MKKREEFRQSNYHHTITGSGFGSNTDHNDGNLFYNSKAAFINNPGLSRRDFLKILGANLAGLLLPLRLPGDNDPEDSWPVIRIEDLPVDVRSILIKTPRAALNSKGYLTLKTADLPPAEVPLFPTQWNLEHNKPYHRLAADKSWGIVLHWYGDKDNFDRSIKGYLRGFDSFRRIEDETVQTSAHFLIGDESPHSSQGPIDNSIGIIQIQAPDQDGVPLIASHLRYLDYEAHKEKKQYFVRAYYQLARHDDHVHSLLQEMFDGPREDPNQRTIAIEIAGFNFDQPEYYPSGQKIANVLATVWAIMRRYRIPACNILGHHEIQLGKADPGKKLMAMIRFLLGVKALLEADPLMCTLIFGQFLDEKLDRRKAVERYFKFVHEYTTLVGSRRSIYEWEIWSKYWLVMSVIDQRKNILLAKNLQPPFAALASLDGNRFLDPHNHEGVDLYIRRKASIATRPSYRVQLIGDGLCLYQGAHSHCGKGTTAIFRHYGADGSDVLSIYEQLSDSTDLVLGRHYPMGLPLGRIQAQKSYQTPYLHFAIAYGSCWEMDLQNMGHPPLNAGQSWISERYLEPLQYLASKHT